MLKAAEQGLKEKDLVLQSIKSELAVVQSQLSSAQTENSHKEGHIVKTKEELTEVRSKLTEAEQARAGLRDPLQRVHHALAGHHLRPDHHDHPVRVRGEDQRVGHRSAS